MTTWKSQLQLCACTFPSHRTALQPWLENTTVQGCNRSGQAFACILPCNSFAEHVWNAKGFGRCVRRVEKPRFCHHRERKAAAAQQHLGWNCVVLDQPSRNAQSLGNPWFGKFGDLWAVWGTSGFGCSQSRGSDTVLGRLSTCKKVFSRLGPEMLTQAYACFDTKLMDGWQQERMFAKGPTTLRAYAQARHGCCRYLQNSGYRARRRKAAKLLSPPSAACNYLTSAGMAFPGIQISKLPQARVQGHSATRTQRRE